jgi:RNA polymerase sigma factor (sigma-70 family)
MPKRWGKEWGQNCGQDGVAETFEAMNDETPEYIPTRSSLLERLKDLDDAESWRDFYNAYWKLIYNTAIKAGLIDAEAQDVVQETVRSVAKKMHDFKYDPALGSFKGWLLQLTRWRILNELKRRQPGLRAGISSADDTAQTLTMERIADPASMNVDAYWDGEWQKNLIDAAIENIKQNVNPKQYEMFYLHVVKKLSAAKVAASLEVNRAQIYLAKHRVSILVKREVRRLEKQMI